LAIPRLIIVEDNIDFGDIVAEVAKFIGYEVDLATSVKQFHEVYAKYSHDVVIADISMPDADTDRFGFVDELIRTSCKAQIIILTGHSESLLRDTEAFAIENGLNILAAMRKPFEIDEFEKILQKAKK